MLDPGGGGGAVCACVSLSVYEREGERGHTPYVCIYVSVCIRMYTHTHTHTHRGGGDSSADDTFHPFARRRGRVVGDAITLVAVISWLFCICIWYSLNLQPKPTVHLVSKETYL